MSYELRTDKSLGKNLRRTFRQQIDSALAVAKGGEEPNDTRIHAMRKHLKKTRAVLQLARKKMGKAFRREDQELRDVGRLMTEIRDAEVRLQLNHVVVGEVSDELTGLGHLLGRVHDLIFLAERLRSERSEKHWGKQDDELLAIIENSEAELRRDGIEMAERFFAEGKSKFGAHLDEWFDDWHRAKDGSVAEALIAA
jgi:CHAD domain-containing protein